MLGVKVPSYGPARRAEGLHAGRTYQEGYAAALRDALRIIVEELPAGAWVDRMHLRKQIERLIVAQPAREEEG